MPIKTALLDLIFPQYCLGCGQEGKLLCGDCAAKIPRQPRKICPLCKKSVRQICCAGSPLQELWALSSYHDYISAESIKKIKYDYISGLAADCWRERLEIFWRSFRHLISPDALLIPVPLHRLRHLERGFNQAELVAQEFSRISGLAVENNLLKRAVRTAPQVGLSGISRVTNIAGIFKINYRAISRAWGRELILIDDVYTTGSTMSECASTLKSSGFSSVSGLVLAVD